MPLTYIIVDADVTTTNHPVFQIVPIETASKWCIEYANGVEDIQSFQLDDGRWYVVHEYVREDTRRRAYRCCLMSEVNGGAEAGELPGMRWPAWKDIGNPYGMSDATIAEYLEG